MCVKLKYINLSGRFLDGLDLVYIKVLRYQSF